MIGQATHGVVVEAPRGTTKECLLVLCALLIGVSLPVASTPSPPDIRFPWNVEVVAWGAGRTGAAIDANGTLHAAFVEPWPSFELVYAQRSDSGWTFHRVDSDAWAPSLALDPVNVPGLLYLGRTDRTVRYAYPWGTTFANETVATLDDDPVEGTSIGFDAQGRAHAAYRTVGSVTGTSRLHYSVRENGTWRMETVYTTFTFTNPYDWPSLRLDSMGRPHIAVYTNGAYRLDYFSRNESGWIREPVDAWGPLRECCDVPSLGIDSQDRPRIAMYNLTGQALRFARYDDLTGRWFLDNVYTEADSKTAPGTTSLAMDAADRPRVSYFETDLRVLMYFSYEPGLGWSREVADPTLWTGNHNALVLDAQGAPHILYNWADGNTTRIKHAWQVWPDTVPPRSSAQPVTPYWRTTAPVQVSAVAADPSGVANVTLWSRFSLDNVSWGPWTSVSTLDAVPWTWAFSVPQGDGYYEFYTTAIDRLGNEEPPPTQADAVLGYDSTPPTSGVLAVSPYWRTAPPLAVDALGADALSGVARLTLWYAHSADNVTWAARIPYASRSTLPWSWSFPFPDGEGYYRFYAIARDVAGNVEPVKTGAEAVAGYRSPPDYVPSNPSPAMSPTVGLSLPIQLSVRVGNLGGDWDTDVTLAFFNSSTPGFPFATFVVPPLSRGATSGLFEASWTSPPIEGLYPVSTSVDYSDDALESNEINNVYTWFVDVVASPVTTLEIGEPNATVGWTYVTSSTSLSFSILDQSGLGIRRTIYRADGGPWANYTATGPFSLSGDGGHLLEWSSEDFAGNVEVLRSQVLRVDDTSPATIIVVGDPKHVSGDTFVKSTTTLTLAAVDSGSPPVGLGETEYRIDVGPWTAYVGGFLVAGEAFHLIEFGSIDLLGNQESIQAFGVVVDDSPPSIVVEVGSPVFQSDALYVGPSSQFTLVSRDLGPIPVGLEVLEWSIQPGTWTPYGAAFGLPTPDGMKRVDYRGSDFLGNADSGTLEAFLDSTPPITTPSHVSGTYPLGTEFSLAAVDAGSGIESTSYRIDSENWTTSFGPFTLQVGTHIVAFRSLDRLGNPELERTIAVEIVDGAPPPPPATPATNWKPVVACIFSVILAVLGVWSAKRVPWRGRGGPAGFRATFGATSLPFVAAEIATAVVSIATGFLSIPPIVGVGAAVDVSILVVGSSVSVWRIRRAPRRSPG